MFEAPRLQNKTGTLEGNRVVRGAVVLAFFLIFFIWELARRKLSLSLGFGQFLYLCTGSAGAILSANWMYRLMTPRTVLVDAGRNPHQWLILVSGGLFLLAMLSSGDLQRFLDGAPRLRSWLALVDLVLPVLALLLAFSRLQIREDGLMIWMRLVPWCHIRCYHWEHEGRLLLTTGFCMPLVKAPLIFTQAIKIPTDKKDAFDAALRQHLTSGEA